MSYLSTWVPYCWEDYHEGALACEHCPWTESCKEASE